MSISKIGYWLFIGSLFGNVVIWAFIPSLGTQGISYLVLAGLALVGLALWGFFSLERLKNWLKRRSTQFSLSMVVMALMSFVILGVLNWVAVQKNFKKDLTANRLHTLSDQTQRVVKGLKEEVRVRVWTTNLTRMSPNIDMKGFFANYGEINSDLLKVEIRNPNEFGADAEADQIRRDNVIVVKDLTSGREARIENFSDSKGEEQLTNAIIQATKGRKKIICFISGHGQPSVENAEAQGISMLRENLEKSNYEVRDLLLVNNEKISEDCEMLANVGPRNVPLEKERALIRDYLATGASMISLIGPRAPKEWREFFKSDGVEVRRDLVVDPFRPDNPVLVATRNYARDLSLTESFNLITVFPEASSLSVPVDATSEQLSVKVFVSSEARAYAKPGSIAEIRNIRPSEGDIKGPIAIGVLIEKNLTPAGESNPAVPTPAPEAPQSSLDRFMDHVMPTAQAQGMPSGSEAAQAEAAEAAPSKSRLIVFSNDLFVVNGVVTQVGNMDLFMNSVSYLMQDSELIGIRPRDLRQTFLKLTPQDIRKVWGFILIVAGLFMVFGFRAARRKSILGT